MERTKSDGAEITQSIKLFDPGHLPLPLALWVGTPNQGTEARRGMGIYGTLLSCAQRASWKSAMSEVLCRTLWGNSNESHSSLGEFIIYVGRQATQIK